MFYWQKKVCDSVFSFFSIFGFFAYLPSILISIREGLWLIVAADTIIYLTCIYMTLNKKIPHVIKAIFGAVLFHGLGIILLYLLGPVGAGGIWLFAATIIAAMLLGRRGAISAFILNTIIQIVFYFLIKYELLPWQIGSDITTTTWLIKAVNFIVLNFVIVIVNSVFVSGFKEVLDRMANTRDASIIGLAKLAEYRDHDTGDHLSRLKNYSILLAMELRHNKKYSQYLTDSYIDDLAISSMLHDIGKVGIGDAILLKKGPLTDDEFNEIKKHAEIGSQVIEEIDKYIEGQSLYTIGRDISISHHEKWDGSGYPKGLSGEDIPLSARIVALVDVLDALLSERPYKKALSFKDSKNIILEQRGKHFDPDVVDAFSNISNKIEKLSEPIL